jgi:protein-S-isoprenylcysteine O-methyltransferase Ste14
LVVNVVVAITAACQWGVALRAFEAVRPRLRSRLAYRSALCPAAMADLQSRPASAVTGGVGWAGLGGLALWIMVARHYGMDGPLAAMTGVVACGLPMALWSVLIDKVHRNRSTGIDWALARPLGQTWRTSAVKIVGLWATWALIAAFYCVGRWYWDAPYLFVMHLLAVVAPVLLLASIPYVLWIDRHLVDPRDGAFAAGSLLVGRRADADPALLADHARSWTIKAFFLAFMISIVPGNWAHVILGDPRAMLGDTAQLAGWLIGVMFMFDVTFATVGYVLTCKPLDAHIRSPQPFAAGWMAALICYPPFILMGDGGPLDYHIGGADWDWWLSGHPTLMQLWGAALVALTAIYAWATIAFGIRFSNLTHRGIITHGPYAWTKHPAYLSKNLFWWLSGLPFLATTGNPVDMVRNTLTLAAVSAVYYWRARTEERHLGLDPAYRAYAAWMAAHGPVTRLFTRAGRGWRAPGREPVAAE